MPTVSIARPQVNGSLLPPAFSEDDLFDLLMDEPRPITIGFLRPEWDLDDAEVSSIFFFATATATAPHTLFWFLA